MIAQGELFDSMAKRAVAERAFLRELEYVESVSSKKGVTRSKINSAVFRAAKSLEMYETRFRTVARAAIKDAERQLP